MSAVERQDRQVVVAVSDTGEGIAAACCRTCSIDSARATAARHASTAASASGLAIVRHIVELHGGNVDVSSPGKGSGSTFRILLPAFSAAGQAWRGRAARAAAVSRVDVRPVLTGVRAVVVDDDRDSRELLTEMLCVRGVQVTATDSGAACLALLDREVPDIIISDIAMPGLDGFRDDGAGARASGRARRPRARRRRFGMRTARGYRAIPGVGLRGLICRSPSTSTSWS